MHRLVTPAAMVAMATAEGVTAEVAAIDDPAAHIIPPCTLKRLPRLASFQSQRAKLLQHCGPSRIGGFERLGLGKKVF